MSDSNHHHQSMPLAFLFPKLEKIASKYCYSDSKVIDFRKLETRPKRKLHQRNYATHLKKKYSSMTMKKSKIQKKSRKILQKVVTELNNESNHLEPEPKLQKSKPSTESQLQLMPNEKKDAVTVANVHLKQQAPNSLYQLVPLAPKLNLASSTDLQLNNPLSEETAFANSKQNRQCMLLTLPKHPYALNK